MKLILVISIIIVILVLAITLLTTKKAYSYKHTIDPLDNNPNTHTNDQEKKID
ncbi:MAG TPA: YtzI protein [Chondromyces sp.]|nr:YtzI protein [Chondromyces sp.]